MLPDSDPIAQTNLYRADGSLTGEETSWQLFLKYESYTVLPVPRWIWHLITKAIQEKKKYTQKTPATPKKTN